MENIDLEEGRIRIKGKWLTEDEIRYAIKMKVSSDDYNVADLANALQTLITEMNKSTVLKIRVPKEMAEEFGKIAKQKGESMESTLRYILMDYLSAEEESEELEEEAAEVYEEVEIEPPKGRQKGVTVNGEFEDEEEEYYIEEEDEDMDFSLGDDESEDELLELESTSPKAKSEEVKSVDDIEIAEISDIEDTDLDTEEEIRQEFRPLPKKRKAAKKKSIIRRKKLKTKTR
jgi:phosphatidate phosphatase APP1